MPFYTFIDETSEDGERYIYNVHVKHRDPVLLLRVMEASSVQIDEF
jgi:hypothetical protein